MAVSELLIYDVSRDVTASVNGSVGGAEAILRRGLDISNRLQVRGQNQ